MKKRAVKRQVPVLPVPDVKNLTREMLGRVAAWMERPEATSVVEGGARPKTPEEMAAVNEARDLAVGYVRLGARQV